MEPLQFLVAVEGLLPYAVLALVVVNVLTRALAHRSHVRQAEGSDDGVSRYLPHTASSVALLLGSFTYLVVAPHGGMVPSVLVVGTLLADLFEFEARRVEVRNGMPMERPESALAGPLLVLLYAGYQSVSFLVEPVWSAVV